MKIITCILIFCFVFSGFSAENKKENESDLSAPLVCGIVTIVVGGVVIYSLWKLCKRIPKVQPPDSPPDSPTNNLGGFNVTVDQNLPEIKFNTGNGDYGIGWYNISKGNNIYQILMASTIESSTNNLDFRAEVHILGWMTDNLNDSNVLIGIYDKNWNLIKSKYGDLRDSNSLIFSDVIRPEGTNGFFRLKITEKFN